MNLTNLKQLEHGPTDSLLWDTFYEHRNDPIFETQIDIEDFATYVAYMANGFIKTGTPAETVCKTITKKIDIVRKVYCEPRLAR